MHQNSFDTITGPLGVTAMRELFCGIRDDRLLRRSSSSSFTPHELGIALLHFSNWGVGGSTNVGSEFDILRYSVLNV
jgi:hypothetical protein